VVRSCCLTTVVVMSMMRGGMRRGGSHLGFDGGGGAETNVWGRRGNERARSVMRKVSYRDGISLGRRDVCWRRSATGRPLMCRCWVVEVVCQRLITEVGVEARAGGWLWNTVRSSNLGKSLLLARERRESREPMVGNDARGVCRGGQCVRGLVQERTERRPGAPGRRAQGEGGRGGEGRWCRHLDD